MLFRYPRPPAASAVQAPHDPDKLIDYTQMMLSGLYSIPTRSAFSSPRRRRHDHLGAAENASHRDHVVKSMAP
jgi:hypothetical protein